MSDFNTFKAEWIGKRIADPTLASDGLPASQWYQCVSLIKQYLREDYGLNPGYWGNASQYWTATAAELLTKFYKVASTEASQGDIVVVSPDHIGIATGNVDASTVEILEQNGSTGNGTGIGPDTIRTRYIAKSRIMGLLRPYVVASPAAPVVTPPTTKYQVTETYPDGKQIQLNKQPTNLWGMNFDFDYMKDHPVETHNQGEIWTVTNRVHHQDGYDYYRRADQVDGFNVLDCSDYTPPPPPYVPPSAPVVVTPAETYTLVTSLPTYTDDLGAINRTNGSQTKLAVGVYYVWAKIGNVYQLGVDNVHAPVDNWVNTLDNVKPAPVVVTAPVHVKTLPSQVPIGTDNDNKWKATFKSFHIDRSADAYIVNQHLTMKEYSGKRKPIVFEKGNEVNIVGTFVKNGVVFYRPRSFKDEYFSWYYGIPIYDDDGTVNLVKKVETDPEKLEQHISDFVHYWKDDFKQIGSLIWDVLVRRKK